MSRQEYQIFTNQAIGLRGLYGYGGLSETAVLTLLQNQSLQEFSRRTGVSYDDLFSIVQTQFINPNSTLIAPLQQLNMPFATLQKMQNGTITPATFKTSLPIAIDARVYMAVRADRPERHRHLGEEQLRPDHDDHHLHRSQPGSRPLLGVGPRVALHHPDNPANLLHGADFMRLIRFIRLWQKLGLSVDQTDDILAALYPAADLPTGASDTADAVLLDQGFLSLLPALGFLYQAMNLLGLTPDSLASLLACWAPIDTTGEDSLYATMFLTAPVQDSAFAIDKVRRLSAGSVAKRRRPRSHPVRRLQFLGRGIRSDSGRLRVD